MSRPRRLMPNAMAEPVTHFLSKELALRHQVLRWVRKPGPLTPALSPSEGERECAARELPPLPFTRGCGALRSDAPTLRRSLPTGTGERSSFERYLRHRP